MENKRNSDIREKIVAGLKIAHKRMIKHKIERNLELIVYEDGEIKHIRPESYIEK